MVRTIPSSSTHSARILILQCSGFNVIIESVGNSGCGLSDPACLCTAQKTIDRIKKELPKKCSQPSDLDVYSGVFNQMCASYPGFPINLAQIAEENSGSKVRAAAWAVPLAVAGAMLI